MIKPFSCFLFTLLMATPAFADEPVEISAATSLAWNRADKTYTASGDTLVTQGRMTLKSEKLVAKYNDEKGSAQINTVTATGNVILTAPPYTAYGEVATYDTATGKAVMTGKSLRVETTEEKMTGADKMEFFDRDNRLTVTGKPVITRGTDTLSAPVMNVFFKNDANGKRVVDRFTASKGVTIKTKRDTVTGDEGVYNIASNSATITGKIHITQGASFVDGDKAVIDLDTGISTLYANSPSGEGKGRVKGVFYPEKKTAP